ncbi:MAG: class I SAM-dependent methyltransferase [Chloroflexi bacterium]|nr:class I SAM-dependent methyltransferase [Chloroflexota bacterium]
MPITEQDVSQDYDAKYSQDGIRNSETYYRWIISLLEPHPGKRLLDIACGMGDLLLAATRQKLASFGVDISIIALNTARSHAPDARYALCDAESLAFPDQSFDYVTMLGSLEHLFSPGTGLLEIRRVLKRDGKALILVPNAYYLPDLVWQVGHHGIGPNHKQMVERFAAVNEWRGYIETAGLRVQKVKRYNLMLPRSKDDWAWYRKRPRRFLHLLARPFIPFNFAHSFLYLCTKAHIVGLAPTPPEWPAPPRLVDLVIQ